MLRRRDPLNGFRFCATATGHNRRVPSTDRGPEAMGLWSVWALRLLAAVSLALAVCLCWAWIETFYRGVSVNVPLSFKSFDRPAPGSRPLGNGDALIGHHYFGDFQVPLVYARDLRHSISPYLRSIPEQYPPFVQILFVPLSFLPLRAAAATYLGLSVGLFLVPLWLLLKPWRFEYRVIFLIPTAVLTTGFITAFDRGNSIGLAVGFLAWALWAWKTNRWIWCGAFLVAAIGLKAYPAALLVVPLAFRRYKFTALVAAAVLALNLFVLAFYPGGLLRNLREVLPTLKGDSSTGFQLISWSLYSAVPKTAGLLFGPSTADKVLDHQSAFMWIPSIVYMLLLYFVIQRGRVPQWCWGPLALASMQLVVPGNFAYTSLWVAAGAVWYARGNLVDLPPDTRAPDRDAESTTLRVVLLLALTVTLTPSVFAISGVGGFETRLTMYLSPLLLALALGVAAVQSLRPVADEPRVTELAI
jgi:hypothetical protein